MQFSTVSASQLIGPGVTMVAHILMYTALGKLLLKHSFAYYQLLHTGRSWTHSKVTLVRNLAWLTTAYLEIIIITILWKEIGYQTDNVHLIRNNNKKSHASKKVKIQNKMCSFSFVNSQTPAFQKYLGGIRRTWLVTHLDKWTQSKW